AGVVHGGGRRHHERAPRLDRSGRLDPRRRVPRAGEDRGLQPEPPLLPKLLRWIPGPSRLARGAHLRGQPWLCSDPVLERAVGLRPRRLRHPRRDLPLIASGRDQSSRPSLLSTDSSNAPVRRRSVTAAMSEPSSRSASRNATRSRIASRAPPGAAPAPAPASSGARRSSACAATNASRAITTSAFETTSRAWRAAVIPMLTWFSWPPLQPLEPAARGGPRVLHSETSDAAVYCT